MIKTFKSNKFRPNAVTQAVMTLLAVAAVSQTAQAGPGYGDAYDLNNNPFIIQSYFAQSPTGFKLWTKVAADGTTVLDAVTGQPVLDSALGAPDGYDPANRLAFKAALIAKYGPAGMPQGANGPSGKALRKFVDPLPLLSEANAAGVRSNVKKMADGVTDKYIPVAKSSKWRNPQGVVSGDDYYEIASVEYKDRFHSDLGNTTTLRGYVQIDQEASNGRTPLPGSKAVALKYPDGSQIYMAGSDANGKPTGLQVAALAYDNPHFLGPVIQATQNVPTRVKFLNLLPVGRAELGTPNADGSANVIARNGDLFLPVDPSITGAGFGPDGVTTYTQNRGNIHLHGGDSPWISDGGPHTWITPQGEADPANPKGLASPTAAIDPTVLASYLRGPGALNVPDMYDPGAGAMTYYFPNGQSARMEWYHDHTVGITRLNAYAGLVSAYFLTDATEQSMIADGKLPGADATIPLILGDRTFVPDDIEWQDARWNTSAWGKPGDSWMPHVYETVQDPNQATNFNSVGRWHWGPWFWPSYPSAYNLPSGAYGDVTATPEAWQDTPTVNGVAYPTMTVEPKPYRLRVLNAANDRAISFNLFVADDTVVTDDGRTNTEMKMVPVASWANTCADGGITRWDPVTNCVPQTWSTDVYGHNGGVPDPTTQGPTLFQIGNEGGRLPGVAKKDPQPTNFLLDKGRAAVLNMDWSNSGIVLGNAERADIVVDFSAYAGKTLLVYSDTGAPVPAADPRNEYFTGYGDNSATGGAEDTRPGYGPNSRTIMQIKVAAAVTTPSTMATLDPVALDTDLKLAYKATQETPVVAQSAYNGALGTNWNDTLSFATVFTGSVKQPSFQFVPGTPNVFFNSFLLQKDAAGNYLDGSGYTRVPTATVVGGGGAGATVTPSMKISKINVINGGSGYKLAPIVTITSTGKGSGANATATLNLSAVAVVMGGATIAGQTPAITFSAPQTAGGITATGTLVRNTAGAVTGVTITNPGSGYASAPNATVTGMTGVVLTTSGSVSAITLVQPDPGNVLSVGGGGYVDLSTAASEPNNPRPGLLITITAPTNAGGVTARAGATGSIFDLTVNNSGVGYTSAPTVSFTPSPFEPVYAAVANTNSNYTPLNIAKVAPTFKADTAVVNGAQTGSILVKTKAIQELFDPTYGRLNATFGVEIPYTSALTQTTIPLGYVDGPTEEIADGETQIWKITHNGVDTHPIHFHLVNVQLINRVGWDNFVTPPEPNELGWKETIKMSPLEDVIVAVRAKKPKLPGFGLPNSVRLLDPSQPVGATAGFTQIDPNTGLPAPMGNDYYDFGWEYVWHCHILGHEENDFMRPIVFRANEAVPIQPFLSLAKLAGNQVNVAWTDNSATEYKFRVERSDDLGLTWNSMGETLANATAFVDTNPGAVIGSNYRVVAVGANGEGTSNVLTTDIVPAAPTGLVATARNSLSANTNLSWVDGSNNEQFFAVMRSADGGVTWTQVGTVLTTAAQRTATGAAFTYTDTTSQASVAYQYQVTANNGGGASTPTNTVSVPVIPAPAASTINSAVVASSTSVLVTYVDNSTTETSLELQRALVFNNVTGPFTTISTVTRAAGNALIASTGNVNTFSSVGLTPGQTYAFQVLVKNAVYPAGIASNVVQATPALAVPTGLAATARVATAANLNVVLSWVDASTDETGFTVERSADGVTWVTACTATRTAAQGLAVGGTAVTCTDTTALAGAAQYRVKATNAAGASAASAAVTVPAFPVPAAATVLAAAARTTSASVVLTWGDSSNNETSFSVQRSADGGVTFTTVGTVARTAAQTTAATAVATTFTDTTALGTAAYVYRVYAVGLGGNSAAATVNVAAVAAPAAPTTLTAAARSTSASVVLSWADASTTETSFLVQRSADGGVTWNAGATVTRTAAQTTATGGTAVTYTDATALGSAAYVYRVYAVGVGGNSATAPTVSVAKIAAPAAPTTLAAAVRSTAASVVLTWVDASTTETSFRVEKSADNVTWTTAGTVTRTAAQTTATGGTAPTYTDTAASASVTTYYRVFAVGLGGDSAAASNVLTVAPMIPAAPTGLAAAARSSSASVVLTWVDNSTFETSYLIERSADAGATWLPLASQTRTAALTLATGGTAPTYTDATAAAGSAYQYRVTATGLGGAGPATTAVSVAAIAVPTAPTISLARNAANNTVSITDTSTTETGFVVQRAPVTGTVVTPAAGTAGTSMTGGTVGTFVTVTTLTRTAAQTTATGGAAVTYADTTAAALVAGTTWAYRVVATGLATGNGTTDTSSLTYVKR